MEDSNRNKTRIIPRLDVKGENLVKGVHLEGLRVLGTPGDFAKVYYEELADEIIFIDSVASLYGRNNLKEIVSRAAQEIFVPLTVGGGIRSISDVTELLESGADKVAVNSALFNNPDLISEIANHYGSQCVVVSITFTKDDGKYMCLSENGREYTGKELFSWISQVIDLGAGEILLTSVDHEGTGKGFDLQLFREVSDLSSVPLIACGGAGEPSHVKDLIECTNIDAVAVSSLLHYELATRGFEIQTSLGNKRFIDNAQNIELNKIRKGINPTSIQDLKKFLISNHIPLRFNENIYS